MSGSRRTARALPAVALGVVSSFGSASGQVPIIELEYIFYAAARVETSLDPGPATRASVQVARGSVVVPFAYESPRTLLAARVSASRVGVAPRPLDPDRDEPLDALHDLDLNLLLVRELSDAWELAVVASPGVASDLRRLDTGHLTLQGALLATRTVRPSLSWGLGVSATNAFGASTVVPVVSLSWAGEKLRADLLLPASASVAWSPLERFEAGIAAEISGNAYRLGLEGELRDAVVRYSVVDVGPTLSLRPIPALRLTLRGGASLQRRLEIEGADGTRIQDARLGRGWSIGVAAAWLLARAGDS